MAARSGSGTRTFKVLVQSKGNSIELSHYIDKNIRAINDMGIFVRMEKIGVGDLDNEMIEILRKSGITRLPAMVTGDQYPVIGKDKIINMFENIINSHRRGPDMFGGLGADLGADLGSNIGDFWSRELFATGKDGKIVPRKDDEAEYDNGKTDIEQRMRDYNQRVPKHRTGGNTRERDFNPEPTSRRRHREEPEPNDNIDDYGGGGDYDEPMQGPGGDLMGMNDDALDKKMMDALLQNCQTSDY